MLQVMSPVESSWIKRPGKNVCMKTSREQTGSEMGGNSQIVDTCFSVSMSTIVYLAFEKKLQ